MVVVPKTLARKLPIYGIFLYEDIGLNCINKPKQTCRLLIFYVFQFNSQTVLFCGYCFQLKTLFERVLNRLMSSQVIETRLSVLKPFK